MPQQAGEGHLGLYLDGAAVAGSPFALRVAANQASPEHCLLVAAHAGRAGTPESLHQPLPTALVAGHDSRVRRAA